MSEDLHYLSASNLRQKLLSKEVSSVELVQASLNRISSVNPKLNAVVTLAEDKALKQAHKADDALTKGEELGVLHGLPMLHKDLASTKGIRTTFGSLIYKDFVPLTNDLIIDRVQDAGAISLGKTNTPEFGAGSQTFNSVFGTTKNPYDPSKTCGGSSGGAAVALATGMTPLADGSDMGGSLRNPAAFCNIVGFRPTPGLVASYPSKAGWGTLGVQGPMARTVQDVALLLSAMAGYDARVPISRTDDPKSFLKPLERDFRGTRIAWAVEAFADLPFDKSITDTLKPRQTIFKDLACELAAPKLDFSGADEAFKVFRAHSFAGKHYQTLEKHRDKLKDTVIWNIEEGLKLSALDLAKAEEKRTKLFVRIAKLMQDYDYIVLPVTQVPPFSIQTEFITEINGQSMPDYISWMRSCYYISALGNPAISVPAGFTKEGLPVGLQIVGRYGHDFEVLQLAHAFEQATNYGQQRPSI